MVKCLICGKEVKNLGQHLAFTHNSNIENYEVEFNNFIIPKCPICGKNRQHRGNLKYNSTCGNDICKKENYSIILKKASTKEVKNKISNSMKKAHLEGRAWNIGRSRWNNEPSKPEEFFIKIIENNFKDKNYEREYNVGIYSIDFAWIHKKIAIEIDGEQHYRFEEYIARDKKKDKILIQNGWKVLRINWKEFCNNIDKYINICKDFVDNNQLNLDMNIEVDYDLLERAIKYNNNIPTQCLKKHEKEKLNLERIQLVINSNIEFDKIGWVNKLSELINMRPQKVNAWMKKYMKDFYEDKCYKRKKN